MFKRLCLIIVACLALCEAKAQSLADIQSPKITPPAPDAAALGKYGQIPVDKVTGIPSISIPLYEIKTPRFSLPISLSYHASGIKVDEIASWVGIGWSLNAGGVITRSIVGIADERGFLLETVPKAADIRFPRDSGYLQQVSKGLVDSQPDNFFYNFADKSGAFVFDDNKKPLTIPYKPLKITFTSAPVPARGSFTVLDENGNTYFFNDTEYAYSGVSNQLTGTSAWYLSQMVSADKSDTVKFAYSADPVVQNSYSFSFTQNLGPTPPAGGGPLGGINLWPIVSTINQTSYDQIHLSSIVYKGGKAEFISKTGRLDNGNVLLDSVIVSNYDYVTKKYYRLKSIKLLTDYFVTTLTNQPGYSSGETNKHRLRLTGLLERDAGNSPIRTHRFEYNATALPPVSNFGQDKWGYYNGHWENKTLLEAQQVVYTSGTFKSLFNVGGTNGADRSASPTNMQAGMLQKITYPTGGYALFNYECNQVLAPEINTYTALASAAGYYQETTITNYTPTADMLTGGGDVFHILIKKLNSISSAQAVKPNVELSRASDGAVLYSAQANSSADIDVTIPLTLQANVQYKLKAIAKGGDFNTQIDLIPTASISTTYKVAGDPVATDIGGLRISSINNFDNNGAAITKETYKYGANESGVGDYLSPASLMINESPHHYQFTGDSPLAMEATFSNNSVYPLSSLGGSPVGYSQVSVYNGDQTQNTGKSVYGYTIIPDSILLLSTATVPVAIPYILRYYFRTPDIKPIPMLWKNGEPVYEGHYKALSNGQYALVKEKFTSFNQLSRAAARGLYISRSIEFNGAPGDFYSSGWNLNDFFIYDYPISSGSRVPQQIRTIDYAADGITKMQQDTINYYYDNLNHVFPTRITQKSSRSETLQKLVSYPQDMVNAGKDPTGIYAAMSTANMITPTIEFTESKNGTQLMKSKTNYALSSNLIEPQTVELQTLANPSEIRLNYQKYDTKGNVLTVSKQGAPTQRYIWDYRRAYPIAQIINAGTDTVAYCSFEADGTGNWSIASTQRDTTTSVSGNKSYKLSNGNITKSGLTALNIYVISYWTRNTSPLTITGTITGFPIKGVTINGWTYYEHQVTGLTTATISGTGNIDELRLYPKGAQMTTYTYAPLIGITSSMDAKNSPTYYEYDGFQRLKNIKDYQGNIVKSFDYNYRPQ